MAASNRKRWSGYSHPGDAGIGKSRLVHELKEQVADSADAWLVECQCSPYESNTTLYPVIHYFKTEVLQFNDELSEEEKASRVIGFLTEYGFNEEDISILAEIFDAPIQPSANALVSPDQRHAVIFSGLAQLLKQRASYQPVLVIFEDLHWADASTNKLIERLLQERLPSNLLLLLTFRPGYKPRWLTTENVTRLVVQRLSKKDSGSLIETVYGGEKMDEKIRVRLMEKTDGNPLFIETLTRSVTERGKSSIESIPNSLHDSLAARLDQLGPSKLVAQHAAVIGREFTFSLLNECLDIAPNLLESSLRHLTEAQLITTPADEHESYRFKHALIRDSAYDSLLKADKTAIHGVIAKALSSNPNVSPALLANHYDLAGLYEDAALCWLDAAKTALNQAAAREAFGLCEKGLAAIDRATPSDPVTHTKIELLLTLGPAVIATRGYTDHRLEKAYAEALTLSQELGANDRSFTALFGTFTFNIVSAKHEKAHQVTKHLTEIAQAQGDKELVAEANMASGLSKFFIGDFLSSHTYFTKTLEIYSTEIHGHHAVTFGQDPKMIALAHLGWIKFILGTPGAPETSAQAISHARALRHPFTLTYALTYDGATQLYSGNIKASISSLEEAIVLSDKHRIRGVEILARVFQSMVDVFVNPSAETISAAERLIENYKNSSASMFLTCWNTELGLAYLNLGDMGKAQDRLQLARQQMQEYGERWYEFPLLNAEAILALRQNNPEAAAECRQLALMLLEQSECRGWLSQERFSASEYS